MIKNVTASFCCEKNKLILQIYVYAYVIHNVIIFYS